MSRPYTSTPPSHHQHHNQHATAESSSLSAILASQRAQQSSPHHSMDGRQPEYPQSGLSSPYQHAPSHPYHNGHHSESSSTADQASAVQYPAGQDYKSSNFSSSATPDSSYGLPQSARSGSFPDYIQRSYADGQPGQQGPQQARYPPGAQPGHAAMAQSSSPSLSNMPDHGHAHHQHRPNGVGHAVGGSGGSGNSSHSSMIKSDGDVPIDPSIAQSSPTYPPPHSYSPYPPQQHEMPHYPGQPMTSYARPEWAGQYGQPMQYGGSPATSAGGAPNMVANSMPRPPPVGVAPMMSSMMTARPDMVMNGYSNSFIQGGHPLSTVYSFVPIPGAQQHKRPRRRYEEIERMYKCGWNGCEKAYGTLNHLNAHVTMQSHGSKRTPEEFKEIRKEWKAKKKEEETARKQDDERRRQEAQQQGDSGQQQGQPAQYGQQHMMPPQMGGPQLPPIGYQAAGGQAPAHYPQPQPGVDGAQQYGGGGQMYPGQGYPNSPYAQSGMPYQQR